METTTSKNSLGALLAEVDARFSIPPREGGWIENADAVSIEVEDVAPVDEREELRGVVWINGEATEEFEPVTFAELKKILENLGLKKQWVTTDHPNIHYFDLFR